MRVSFSQRKPQETGVSYGVFHTVFMYVYTGLSGDSRVHT
jgi:hypothetical protein